MSVLDGGANRGDDAESMVAYQSASRSTSSQVEAGPTPSLDGLANSWSLDGAGHPELEWNASIPGVVSTLQYLRAAYEVPVGVEGEPIRETCEWIELAQLRLGLVAAHPGRLDDKTLQALEDHLRYGEASWVEVGLTNLDVRSLDRESRVGFYAPVDASRLHRTLEDPLALYKHFAEVVALASGPIPEVGGRPERTVLGIRGLARRQSGGVPETQPTWCQDMAYQDTFVVLRPDRTAQQFKGGTYPNHLASSEGKDVDGDKIKDAPLLKPGSYRGRGRGGWFDPTHSPAYDLFRDAGHESRGDRNGLPAWRNHSAGSELIRMANGKLEDVSVSTADKATSDKSLDSAGAIIFHAGGGLGPISYGCQTLPPDDYGDFMRAMDDPKAAAAYDAWDWENERVGNGLSQVGTTASFRYVLIDAREFLLDHPDFGT